MKHRYGEWSDDQFFYALRKIEKQIFFLLLCVDPKEKYNYEDENIDVDKAFDSLLRKIGGMNSLLNELPELVSVMSMLEAARIEYNNPDFEFGVYRKLVLDAGATVKKLKEV